MTGLKQPSDKAKFYFISLGAIYKVNGKRSRLESGRPMMKAFLILAARSNLEPGSGNGAEATDTQLFKR